MLAADGCASSSNNPACCCCAVWALGGPREWRSPCSDSHWFGQAQQVADVSKLSARISMHVPEYSLKLSRPFAYYSAIFSIVVGGNQIAE
jgi:hypothetical protein